MTKMLLGTILFLAVLIQITIIGINGFSLECPSDCSGIGCTCDSNCQVCNNQQCSQCKQGYFKSNDNTPCVECGSVFGDICMFCQDYNGCGQCSNNQRVYDNDCNLWYCLGSVQSVDPKLTEIRDTLILVIDQFGLGNTYLDIFIDYIDEFDKLNEYRGYVASNNFIEIKERYENFIDTEINIIQDGNNNFWTRAATIDGLTEVAEHLGINQDNPIIYSHNDFSDWHDYEIANLFGSTNDIDSDLTSSISGRRLGELCGEDNGIGIYDIFQTPDQDSDLKNFAPSVVNQGACGSCWAFASTAQFEINYNIWEGRTVTNDNVAKFSEEYVIDCATDCDGNCDLGTCGGGSDYSVPSYLEREGHCIWSEYVGLGYNGANSDRRSCDECPIGCRVFPNNVVLLQSNTFSNSNFAKFIAARNANYFDNKAIQFQVRLLKATKGKKDKVLFITNTTNFGGSNQFIWFGEDCDSINENDNDGHAMVIVGQKTLTVSNTDYSFLEVRNSWGTKWGDNGYFLMAQFVSYGKCKPSNYQFNTFGKICPPDADELEICLLSSAKFDWLPKDSDRCSDSRDCTYLDYDPNCNSPFNFTNGCIGFCDTGYFLYDTRYKCQECDFDNCALCSDFVGCTTCNSGFQLNQACPVNLCLETAQF